MTDRIESALADLGSEHNPPPEWDRRVLRAVRPPSLWSCRIVALILLVVAIGDAVLLRSRLARVEDYGQRCRALVPVGDLYCLDHPELCRGRQQ